MVRPMEEHGSPGAQKEVSTSRSPSPFSFTYSEIVHLPFIASINYSFCPTFANGAPKGRKDGCLVTRVSRFFSQASWFMTYPT